MLGPHPLATELAGNQGKMSKRLLQRWAIWTIVGASLVWTILDWQSLSKVQDRLGSLIWITVAIIASEVLFITGAILVALSMGRHIFAGAGANPLRWIAAIRSLRATYRDLSQRVGNSPLFIWGFRMNWVGAASTGIVLALGIVIVLPVNAWGLLVFPMLDLAATFGWRVLIAMRIRAMREPT